MQALDWVDKQILAAGKPAPGIVCLAFRWITNSVARESFKAAIGSLFSPLQLAVLVRWDSQLREQ